MHDLEMAKLFPMPRWKTWAQNHYMSGACTKAATVFRSNVERVFLVSLIPGHAFFDGELWKKHCLEAMRQVETDDEFHDEVSSLAGWLYNEEMEGIDPSEAKRHFYEANGNVGIMWSNNGAMHAALHGLLQTMLIQGYSAFEVLAEDICRNAIEERNGSVTIPTDKQWKSLGFGSRNKMRATYLHVFTTENDSLLRVLKYSEIDAIALVRNVLVHKAGVLDQTFIDGSEKVPELANLRSPGRGAPIIITGSQVRSLLDSTIMAGYDLLHAADRWISAHP